jgi:hypothetical protein
MMQILRRYELADIKTDKTRFIAKCKAEGCPWRIHASRIFYGKTIEVWEYMLFLKEKQELILIKQLSIVVIIVHAFCSCNYSLQSVTKQEVPSHPLLVFSFLKLLLCALT